ncbi:hypothetical protein HEK131_36720 [Streptomyces seoulensis]|nr:hypothetical protein HEK131_36720 [Streptomyces seoulensis]
MERRAILTLEWCDRRVIQCVWSGSAMSNRSGEEVVVGGTVVAFREAVTQVTMLATEFRLQPTP